MENAGGGSTGPGARSYLPWRNVRVNVKSYGATPWEAHQLDALVYAFMTGLDDRFAQDTWVRSATVAGGPLPLRDPDTDWPYVLSVFDVGASPGG